MQRINEVKSEFAKIKQDVAEIQKQQKEALDQMKIEFDKLLSGLSSLENKVSSSDVSCCLSVLISTLLLYIAIIFYALDDMANVIADAGQICVLLANC